MRPSGRLPIFGTKNWFLKSDLVNGLLHSSATALSQLLTANFTCLSNVGHSQFLENVSCFDIFFPCFRTAVNELQNLQYLPRVSEPRETLIEDRTRCHADHVGHGLDRQTTAAVGVLKAVHVGKR